MAALQNNNFLFADLLESKNDIVAIGGNLDTANLLQAYRLGIFPWPDENHNLLWYYPQERMILFLDEFKVSKSLNRQLKKTDYQVKADNNFSEVITNCATIARKGQQGSWVTNGIKNAYLELHKLGYAHSIEIYKEKQLKAGLYGIALGKYFCGESMFSLERDASKIALYYLVQLLRLQNYHFIDCQVYTKHLESLGAKLTHKSNFKKLLTKALDYPDEAKSWSNYDFLQL